MKRLRLALILLVALTSSQVASAQQVGGGWPKILGTQTATGTTVGFNVAAIVPTKHTFVMVVTGGPATCTGQPQYSLDFVNWFSLGSAITCTATAAGVVVDTPVLFVRMNLTALTGGTSPTVKTLYLGTH